MNKKIKNYYKKYKLNGLVKYFNYLLLIIITISLIPNQNIIYENDNYVKEEDTYSYVFIDNDIKKEYILEHYNLTEKQFDTLCAIVLSEATTNSYEDAYAVINVIYNRAHDKKWINSVDKTFGKGKGESLYYQAISPNQFVVYQKGTYLRNMNNTKSVGYDAILDFLYEENTLHNYLSFRSNFVKINNYETFTDNGNKFFNLMNEINRV